MACPCTVYEHAAYTSIPLKASRVFSPPLPDPNITKIMQRSTFSAVDRERKSVNRSCATPEAHTRSSPKRFQPMSMHLGTRQTAVEKLYQEFDLAISRHNAPHCKTRKYKPRLLCCAKLVRFPRNKNSFSPAHPVVTLLLLLFLPFFQVHFCEARLERLFRLFRRL